MSEPPFEPIMPPPPTAFCQSCGRPLQPDELRRVGPAVFCEPCLIARLGTNAAPAGSTPPMPDGGWPWTRPAGPEGGWPWSAPTNPVAAGMPRSSINPGLAALLGVIPGVGAMYNEQYAKGVAHLLIFSVLVSLSNVTSIFGILLAGWIIYMVVEANHTARARRDGTPLPNPFGLNDIGERMGFGRAWPPAAPGAPRSMADTFSSVANDVFNQAAPRTPTAPPTVAPVPEPAWGAPTDRYRSPQQESLIPSASATYGQNPYAHVPYTQPPYPPVPPAGAPMPPYPAYDYGANPQFAAGFDPGAAYAATGYPPAGAPPFPASPFSAPAVPPSRFPAGAAWLIGLGLFFLLGTTGLFSGLPGATLPGFVLAGFGVWLFARNYTRAASTAVSGIAEGSEPHEHSAQLFRLCFALRASLMLLLVSALILLHGFHIVRWEHSWPLLIIGVGALMLLNRFINGFRLAAMPVQSPYAPAGWPTGTPTYPPHQPGYEYPSAAPVTAEAPAEPNPPFSERNDREAL